MKRVWEILDHLITQLSSINEVEKVVLFGSRARGDAEERSDIDIAIDAPNANQRQWLNIVEIVEEANTLLSFDIIRYDEASDILRARIETEGISLYEQYKESAKSA
ncbi:nucleotidyltransferase domain-containing protein [bacterium]|nr:nucleotidyltransferase domain-containing protein [bacterium]